MRRLISSALYSSGLDSSGYDAASGMKEEDLSMVRPSESELELIEMWEGAPARIKKIDPFGQRSAALGQMVAAKA